MLRRVGARFGRSDNLHRRRPATRNHDRDGREGDRLDRRLTLPLVDDTMRQSMCLLFAKASLAPDAFDDPQAFARQLLALRSLDAPSEQPGSAPGA